MGWSSLKEVKESGEQYSPSYKYMYDRCDISKALLRYRRHTMLRHHKLKAQGVIIM